MEKNKLIIGIVITLVLIVSGFAIFYPIQQKDLILVEEQIREPEEYYGSSTYGQCQRDNDCFVSGCNAEVCQSRAEEERVTICILPDKPTPKQLNYGCQCVNQKCQWSK